MHAVRMDEALLRDATETASLLVGLTEDEAAALAASRDLEFRTVDEPGSFTYDLRWRRVSAKTDGSTVLQAWAG
jgi:hypothetical protein